MLDSVLPVAVVDRFRGPEEGSLRGITGQSLGAINEFPAVFFGGLPDADGTIRVDITVHQINVWLDGRVAALPANRVVQIHVFTPEAPYNPTANQNPVGIFVPSLNLDPAFTRGRAAMIGGSNPVGGPIGFELTLFFNQFTRTPGFVRNMSIGNVDQFRAFHTWAFDPPLRIPAGNGIAVQWLDSGAAGFIPGMTVTMLYHERGIL